ncbi:MAG: hypothetical protein ACRDEA_18060, partial [Microcystaceae cyanobacterium]
ITAFTNVAVELRWEVVDRPEADHDTADRDTANKVKAIHIYINERLYEDHRATVANLYPRKRTSGFPLDIKMMYIPPLRALCFYQAIDIYRQMRNRQAQTLVGMEESESFDIAELDCPSVRIGNLSLRDVIMAIPRPNHPDLPLFHHVEAKFQKEGHVFSYFPRYKQEAHNILLGLIPYLESHHGPGIRGFFKTEEVAQDLATPLKHEQMEQQITPEIEWNPTPKQNGTVASSKNAIAKCASDKKYKLAPPKANITGHENCNWTATRLMYFCWLNHFYRDERWLAALIRKFWDTAWDYWENRNGDDSVIEEP